MYPPILSTKDRLIQTAAHLFRTHGYHGVGLNDLLAQAKAPKGSLYHHFPEGKPDLAIAAATWASDEVLRVIASSFDNAEDFLSGATTMCFKLAKLFDQTGSWDTCPIGATLFEGPDNSNFRDCAQHLYDGWIGEIRSHAEIFGHSLQEAQIMAEKFFILIQGGWLLARSRRSSDTLRDLPKHL